MKSKKSKQQYYYCVNCGHMEDWGFERLKNQVCSDCKYDDLTFLSASEFNKIKKERDEWKSYYL